MADNYLEKQMEQYQARKAAWEKERKYSKKRVPAGKPKQPGTATTESKEEVTSKDF